MNYIAIDTSGVNLTLIVCKQNIISVHHDSSCGVKHSVELMPQLEKLIERANFNLKDADFFACVVGAGSFTGIRIGVATVKALALCFNKPVLSITSFDTLAYNDISKDTLCVINAKHGHYYACGYSGGKVVFEPSYVDEQQVKDLSKQFTIISFERLEAFDGTNVVSVAEGLVKAIEHKANCVISADKLEPLYIRKSQAEEGR